MKKNILLIVCIICLSLTACGNENASDQDNTANTVNSKIESNNSEPEAKRDFPEGDYTDTGSGTFFVTTVSGTSEGGNIPIVYIAPDTALIEIGYDSTAFDGSHLCYFYINGMLHDKMQLGDTQGTLTLESDLLSPGIYKVEVVQYENDDPSGTIITYKTGSYEIKIK